MLDSFLPHPAHLEADSVDVLASAADCYRAARFFRMDRSLIALSLFHLRSSSGAAAAAAADSTPSMLAEMIGPKTGFTLLSDEPGAGFSVGCVGRFWEPDLPTKHVPPEQFAEFNEPGWGKLAFALDIIPHGDGTSRVLLELRMAATDVESWKAFQRHFRVIGPFSRWLRRHVLSLLKSDLGDPESKAHTAPMPGDELVPNAMDQTTSSIVIDAPPEAIWPYLIQMGRGRAGFYRFDLWDNGGNPSADAIESDFQSLKPGDLIPTNDDQTDGFFVSIVDTPNTLVLLSSTNLETGEAIEPDEVLPSYYWRTSWAFSLKPIDPGQTRLIARCRVDSSSPYLSLSNSVAVPVHHFMQEEQLHNIKWRAEGKREPAHSGLGDVGEGLIGAIGILINLVTPMLRRRRNHWGLDESTAARDYPGDTYVPQPRWYWTHGIEIDAQPGEVWPWIAQIGQEKAGFYSYQWLENIAGCDVQNASHVHPAWQRLQVGDGIRLHPAMPPIPVVAIEPGQWFVVHAHQSTRGERGEERFVSASWLFFIEPLDGGQRCRLISRFRSDYSGDWATRLAFGPVVGESVGFVMDRRMLLGIQERVMASKERPQPPRLPYS